MKILPIFYGLTLPLLATFSLPAQETGAGGSDQDLLNRLATPDAQTAALGVQQEEFLVFERRLRGEGLPEDYQKQFENTYKRVVDLLVSDRIDETTARSLRDRHRKLVEIAHQLVRQNNFAADYEKKVYDRLVKLQKDIDEAAIEPQKVPDSIKTPIFNGHQAWLEDVILWGRFSGKLSKGEFSRLTRLNQKVERDEDSSKSDYFLTDSEKRSLHRTILTLHREVVGAIK